ncbi:MAG: sorbitol dehydrogenase [candidate division NC10 bacterium]|nr:sorbitol dehydrogenase [candidate division NC10 bacterium]
MKAMKFPEAGKAEIVEVPVPTPGPGEVLVRVRATGICASDVAAFKGTHNFRRPPVITGHELAGEIVTLGQDVTGLRVGDRVALEPHVGCGHCDYCRQDNYHECPEKRFVGVGEWIGAFAEYVVATDSMCHTIPGRMPFDEAAMLEPFCVGLHAVRRADLRMGETVAILGVGTIGMMTLLAARCGGPGWTVVTDPSAAKRELAIRCGADVALDPAREDAAAAILKATGGRGVDVVFVAAAAPGVLDQAVNVCRRMGRIVIIASFFSGGGVEAKLVQQREQTVLGTSMYTGVDYRLAIRLWEQGRLGQFHTLVSERIRLDHAPEAVVALAAGKRPDNIKTIIEFEDEPRA